MISEAEMKAIEARAKDKYKNFYPHAAGPREEGYCTGALEQCELMLEREKVLVDALVSMRDSLRSSKIDSLVAKEALLKYEALKGKT